MMILVLQSSSNLILKSELTYLEQWHSACEAAVFGACGLPAAVVLEAYSKFLDAKHGAPVTFS